MDIKNAFIGAALLGTCFLVGLHGAPFARSAYAKLFPAAEFRSGDFSEIRAKAGSQIVILTTSTCPYCKKTLEILNTQNVMYKEYVIDKSEEAEALFEQRGGGGVPLIYIGDREIRGFRESVIADSLAALGHSSASN